MERRRARWGIECECVVGEGGLRTGSRLAEATALSLSLSLSLPLSLSLSLERGVAAVGGLTSFFASFCCTRASLAISQCLLGMPPPSDGADAPVPSPRADPHFPSLLEGLPLPSCFEAFNRLEPASVLRERERGAGGGRWLSDMPGGKSKQ